jgi:hypothetical protein
MYDNPLISVALVRRVTSSRRALAQARTRSEGRETG